MTSRDIKTFLQQHMDHDAFEKMWSTLRPTLERLDEEYNASILAARNTALQKAKKNAIEDIQEHQSFLRISTLQDDTE